MKGIKFSNKIPVVIRNTHDYQMYQLQQEFNKILLTQQVVNSYSSPCNYAKQRINLMILNQL